MIVRTIETRDGSEPVTEAMRKAVIGFVGRETIEEMHRSWQVAERLGLPQPTPLNMLALMAMDN